MVIFGKEENISKIKKSIEEDISHLMSGKSYSDENFPVASFLMTKEIRKIVRIFYFFARMADDIADHQTLRPNQKKKILFFFDKAMQRTKKLTTQFLMK